MKETKSMPFNLHTRTKQAVVGVIAATMLGGSVAGAQSAPAQSRPAAVAPVSTVPQP
jgi:hypothetical protein